MKKKWRVGLFTVGMMVMLSGCTEEAQQGEADADTSGSVVTEEVAAQEQAQEETVSGETQTTDSDETDEKEAEVKAEDSGDGQQADSETASGIVLENGQQDESTSAIIFYPLQKEYTDQNGRTFGEVTYTIPQLTARSTEAGMINQDILSWYEDFLTYADGMMDTAQADMEYETDSDTVQYGTSAEYSVTYLDDTRLCLLLGGYEYTGGAHGMPFQTALIYDLTSGQRIETKDLFDVTEEEFSSLFIHAFDELIARDPSGYWADAMDYVKEAANFTNANYYLTETGVTFYFEPYTLAAYARGYVEAEVPYDKLPLK